ncbi:MAG: 50S ribosomal protein L34e [Nanoarchaeota archaeon]|nr:50S ribosomal protein L34e [Nanoarchaeota archaeon]
MLKHKNRTFRKVLVKLSDRITTHYRKRNPKAAHCASCSAVLQAVPRKRDYKMSNLPKTMKRPERPYGGVLCSKCMRREMVSRARSI